MLISHERTGLKVDPAAGVIYGLRGRQIGSANRDGYVQVGVIGHKVMLAHRVIWEAVTGDQLSPDLEINHKNFVRDDNRFCNLECVTHKENMRHASRFGRLGGSSPRKLKDGDVSKIKALRSGGLKLRDIADRYGVSMTLISSICNGKRRVSL